MKNCPNNYIKKLMGQVLFYHGQNEEETDSDKLIHADVINHYGSDESSSLHITVLSRSASYDNP
jgi:hypothetical protein